MSNQYKNTDKFLFIRRQYGDIKNIFIGTLDEIYLHIYHLYIVVPQKNASDPFFGINLNIANKELMYTCCLYKINGDGSCKELNSPADLFEFKPTLQKHYTIGE